jgi:hypothetical protein
VGGRTVRIRTVCTAVQIWHGNQGILGTVFEVDFRIWVVVSRPYETVRTTNCGHKKRGTKEVVQQYGFGMENEANFCGTDLVL